MRLEDYKRKVFEEVFGLWNRGEDDQAPEDHLSDCLNIDFGVSQWKTRPGLTTSMNLGYGGKVRKFAGFAGAFNIVLILDDLGNLYTFSTRPGDNATTPILTVPNAIDFTAVTMLDKIYIAMHNGDIGLPGEHLRVLIPGSTPATDEVRDAAGLAPVAGSAMIAADGAAGIVNAGQYKIAVSYITSSGYVTQPGPKIGGVFTPTVYTAPGSKQINLSNIPTGPPGTVKRQILVTKAGLEEYFYLPSDFGGIINDNTTTTAVLDFDDIAVLEDSADSLFDLLEAIPDPLDLQVYNSRLMMGGEFENPSILRGSRPGEPESIDAIDGTVIINKDDGFSVRNMVVIRDTLYVGKNLGIYSTNDNGDVPSSWKVTDVDRTVNVGVHGVADFYSVSSINMARDWTLIADRSGILLMDGIVRKEPITFKVNDIWQSISWNFYHKIMLAVDEQIHKIFCAIPTNNSEENNVLLVGDYNLCPGNIPEMSKIKWCPTQFKPTGSVIRPTSICILYQPPVDKIPRFKIGSLDGSGKIWTMDLDTDHDDGIDIESFFESALLYWEPGWVHFFNASRLRINGTGIVLTSIRGEDNANENTNLPTITLPCPGLERLIRFNFQNEKAKIKFRMTAGRFIISKYEFFGKPMWPMRPEICEEGDVTPPVEVLPPVIISTCPVSPISVGVPFSKTFQAKDGVTPYKWEIIEGGVPGLTLNPDTGVYSGTPTTPGTYNFTVRLTDSG